MAKRKTAAELLKLMKPRKAKLSFYDTLEPKVLAEMEEVRELFVRGDYPGLSKAQVAEFLVKEFQLPVGTKSVIQWLKKEAA